MADGCDNIIISAVRGMLSVTENGRQGRLLATGGGRFKTNHPTLARHEIVFPPEDEARRVMWWGGTRFERGLSVSTPMPPINISRLVGRYVNDSPWQGSLSVIARGNDLIIENVGTLRREGDGSWRLTSDKGSAERFFFEAFNDGQPQRLSFSGNDFVRFPTLEF